MMRRCLLVVLLLVVSMPVMGADNAASDTNEVKLRKWHVGIQSAVTRRNTFDVFGVPGMPPGEVEDRGEGAGLFVGYRFGDRFLLDLQGTYGTHKIVDRPEEIGEAEFLFTGTVLFRERSTLQPFLRGGFGVGAQILTLTPDTGHLISFGTAAIAGGGLQVRLSSRFSLEFEMVSTFMNFLEVYDESSGNLWAENNWQVRTSNWGTRFGTGVVVWF